MICCPTIDGSDFWVSVIAENSRPMTMETRCSKVFFPNYTPEYSTEKPAEGTVVPPLWEHGILFFAFLGLFVHAAVRGGTCAFRLKIVNMLIKNSPRDDRPSIST